MAQAMLSTIDLTVGYRNGKRVAEVLKHLNLSLYAGELVCLLGANGVGKSTLLRTISGVQTALNGVVEVNGRDLTAYSSKELSKLIDIVRIRQHIKSVIDINFYGSEWKKEQALLKDLNLGSTEKTINKKLMSLGMEFQLNKRETYTHGRYVYSFSRYNINSSKW